MNNLEDRVNEAFRESGVSVVEVAAACGISVQAVYKWLSGKSAKIDAVHLFVLERLTHYDAQWLCTGKGHKWKDPKAVAVYEAMRSMPEYKKDALVQASIAFTEPTEQRVNSR